MSLGSGVLMMWFFVGHRNGDDEDGFGLHMMTGQLLILEAVQFWKYKRLRKRDMTIIYNKGLNIQELAWLLLSWLGLSDRALRFRLV